MKKKRNLETRKGLAFASLILLATVGCGRIYNGTYTGSSSSQMIPNETISLQMGQSSGNTMFGNWTGSVSSSGASASGLVEQGSFQGTASGDQITNVTWTVTQGTCVGTYTGNLFYTGNTVNGNLQPQQSGGTFGNGSLSCARFVQLQKQN